MSASLSRIFRFSLFRLLAAMLALFLSAGATLAADVVYPGASLQDSPFFDDGFGVTANSLFPGTTAAPLASGNTVTVRDGSGIGGAVLGGFADAAASYNNRLDITGLTGSVNNRITGGGANNGSVYGNTVTVSNSRFAGGAGGYVFASGDVYNNTLTISDSAWTENIQGGGTMLGKAYGNSVIVANSTSDGDISGGESDGGEVYDNAVGISGNSTVTGDVYGGVSWDFGNANANTVSISGSTVGGDVFGGSTVTGGASNNTVTIGNSIVNSNVRGGRTDQGDAANNAVTIGNGSRVIGRVDAGSTDQGNADNNTVTVSGSTVDRQVRGGRGSVGNANSNTVSISDSTIGTYINGGETSEGDSSNNVVNVSNSRVTEEIAGGYTDVAGNSSGNRVTVTGGSVGSDIWGGSTQKSDASNNTVTVTGVTVGDGVQGGNSERGSASHNTITVTGSTVSGNVAGGGTTIGNAESNTAAIIDSTLLAHAAGGVADTGSANSNTFVMRSGSVAGNVYGGYAITSGNVDGNRVSLNGVAVSGSVYGGYTPQGGSSNNIATISGGSVAGDIYGGHTDSGASINNTVEISGNPAFAPTTSLYGGESLSGGNVFTGNALNLRGQATVANVANFQALRFYLPASIPNGYTALTVTDTITLGSADGTPSVITPVLAANGRAPKAGETFTLIDAANSLGGVVLDAALNTSAKSRKGLFLDYRFRIFQDAAGNVAASVSGVKAARQAEALPQARLAGLAFVNQGADLLLSEGIPAARRPLESPDGPRSGVTPFAVVSGGWSRYETGSHISVGGFNMLAGLAGNILLGDAAEGARPSALTLGAFFEAGWGGYDLSNSFPRAQSFDGDGDTSYVGGGVFARFDHAVGLYLEGSFRGGKVDADFSSSDFVNGEGRKRSADYDSSSSYYGLHAGLGYQWKATDILTADIYTKYTWTRQGGDSLKVDGDPVHFDAVDSHRWRTGARLNFAASERCAPYIGVAYEHEFDGKAAARVRGYSIDKPDLTGGSGMGELGVSFRPLPSDARLSVDLGVQGWLGARDGVTGSLQAKWEF